VEEGRAVYANAKRFVTYIFTSNTAEAAPFIFFAFSGGRIPLGLTVMEVLSIDLGADIVPGLAVVLAISFASLAVLAYWKRKMPKTASFIPAE
jgi:magnesium-transporting ATPase (P-type)